MANFLKFNQPVKVQNLSSDPSSPEAGLIYFNTTANEFRIYDSNAAAWVSLSKSLSDHPSNTSNPHSVTKDQVLSGDLIDNDDIDVVAAIAESKLSLDYATSTLNSAVTTAQGDIDDHKDGTANKHDATEIDFEKADGSKKNIDAASDNVESAIGDLDEAIGALAASPSNYTPTDASIVADHLSAIDTALSSAGGTDFADNLFRISDNSDSSKKIAFEASGITASNVRTITMPDEDVDLGGLQKTSEKGSANGYASLDASGKLPSAQLPVSTMEYKGAWDADTNNPSLSDGTGTNGDFYRVSVAGSQDLGSGSQSFVVGDALIYNGSIWQKIPGDDLVLSVNGATGAVVLDTDDISEPGTPTNKWFTDARAQAACISQTIGDGVTTKSPSEDAVFDALAAKMDEVADDTSPALGGDLDVGSNVIYSSSAIKLGSSDSNFFEMEYVNSQTLTDNTTAVASEFTYAAASFEGVMIEYKIKEASTNNIRVGQIMVANEPSTTASIVDTFTETDDLGVSWSVAFNSGNVELSYTCTSTGNDRTMRAVVKRIVA